MIITSNYPALIWKNGFTMKLNIKKDVMDIINTLNMNQWKALNHIWLEFNHLLIEEKIKLDAVLNAYFKDLRALIKQLKIIKRFSHEELENIVFEL